MAEARGRVGVVLLNFGEPAEPEMEQIVPFLERIFRTNALLEAGASPLDAARRSRELAERRAPRLLEEYRAIGGSPLGAQARAQAELLEAELARRGRDARCYVGMQFTAPSIREAAERARADDVAVLVGLPIYPTCGPSTTIAALAELAGAVKSLGWNVAYHELTGWHTHPAYVELRADAIRETAAAAGLRLDDPRVRLVFSAHGTPRKYIEEGSRYELYTRDTCDRVAGALGVPRYVLGYQNHTNRPVDWTQPDIDDAVRAIDDADAIVVVPISFMHEQSETLAELDVELREVAEEQGLAFHRVPIRHDDPRFIGMLAGLCEAALEDGESRSPALRPCRCRERAGTVCLNRPVADAATL